MGTNYYIEASEPCDKCGLVPSRLHIGKSSAGWCFSLHVIPELGIYTLKDWQKMWKGRTIKDEYGDVVSKGRMNYLITKRQGDRGKVSDSFLRQNSAVWDDTYKLLRHKIDGHLCVGHGDKSYDLMMGDFC